MDQAYLRPDEGNDQMKEMDVALPIKELMIYIEDQWITSSQFPITSWTVY